MSKDYEAYIDRLFADSRLSHAERLLMLYFYRHANEHGACQATYRRIEKETHISLGSISKLMGHLQEIGYIKHEYPLQHGFAGLVSLEGMPPVASDWQEVTPSTVTYRIPRVAEIIVQVKRDSTS